LVFVLILPLVGFFLLLAISCFNRRVLEVGERERAREREREEREREERKRSCSPKRHKCDVYRKTCSVATPVPLGKPPYA